MTNVIDFPVIPRKTHSFTAHLAERDVSEFNHYRCTDCGNHMRLLAHHGCGALYCGCGAEMRPVEAK